MDRSKLFFRENPYAAAPSPERYLAVGSVEAARRRLVESIDRREGVGLVVGPPGTGKSLLCSVIATHYRDRFDVVLLSEARLCTRRALLQHLLHHLGLPFENRSEGELRLALIDRAASGGPASREGLLIVVDEAQSLPGRLLEELRMMAGIVRSGKPRVQLVLAGGPQLDERLAHPKMEAFSQRIGARCYLHPLGLQETATYIRESVRSTGHVPEEIIDGEAMHAVYIASSGIPRLINQTMSRAVAMAEGDGAVRITTATVERAWADLQQLPSPMVNEPQPRKSTAAVVEFGALDDDPMADTVDYEPGSSDIGGDSDQAFEIDEVTESVTETSAVALEDAATIDVVGLFGDGFDEEQWIPAIAPAPPASRPSLETPATVTLATDQCCGQPDGCERVACETRAEFAATRYSGTNNAEANAAEADVRDERADALGCDCRNGCQRPHDCAALSGCVEQSLHAEILSINNDAMQRSIEMVRSEPTVASAIWFGEAELDCEAPAADIQMRDDRDILVIEEDVDLQPQPLLITPRRRESDSDGRAFREMLTRLRDQ